MLRGMTLTYPRDIFGDRTGIWDDRPSQNWLGWDIFWSRVAGQRLNMGGASAYIDHADAIGSTVMETGPAGAVQWDVVNGPWGQVWQQTGTRQSQVFAGMDWQVNDPLMPSATREYSDGLGRWMTPDPLGRKAASLTDSQSWNMYAYVGNNPTSLNDPSGGSIELTCSSADSEKCVEQRHLELQALQQAVGAKAGSYLYENPVTTTDTKGNSTTKYYVGIYSGGPSGKGPEFDKINSVAGEIAPIINDTKNLQLAIAASGSSLTDDLGNSLTLSGRSPGATGFFEGNLRTYLVDPSIALAPLPNVMMLPPSGPGVVTPGIVLGHELGHARGVMTGALPGQTEDDSLRIENKIRVLDDPNAPIRLLHNCPPGACQ